MRLCAWQCSLLTSMGEHPWAQSQTIIVVRSNPSSPAPLGKQGNRPREGQDLPRVTQQTRALPGLNQYPEGLA